MGKVYTAKDLKKMLEKDGWYLVGQTGSHEQYKHAIKKGRVTIPNHKGDVAVGTVKSILKQAGIK